MAPRVFTDSEEILLTAQGRRWLRQRLDATAEELAHVVARINSGDGTDEDLARHERLLNEQDKLSHALRVARLVDGRHDGADVVGLGDHVELEFDDGSARTCLLVHPLEAPRDPERVAVTAPLGRALLGAEPGERVHVDAPDGAYGCLIRSRRRAASTAGEDADAPA